MKIIHICNYYNDNMGYQENILPIYQANKGHNVVVITSTLATDFGFNKSERRMVICDKVVEGVKVRRIAVKGELVNRFVLFKDLGSALEEERPDYIFHHGVTMPSLYAVANYRKKHDVFIVADNHADLNNSGRNPLWLLVYYKYWWRNALKGLDKYFDLYFGVTPIRCLFMEDILGLPHDKIRLLPIGSDTEKFTIAITRENFCKRFGLSNEDIIITTGGKLTPEKRVGNLVEAFLRLPGDNVRLLIFGKILDSRVEELVKSDSRIVCTGWLDREDTIAALKYSDIGVWNMHTTLIEDAVSVGLPVIIRYHGSTCHLIKDSGLFLYEGSTREIQDRISFLIKNPDILSKFREKSKYLAKLLSYKAISTESVRYAYETGPLELHKIFMGPEFLDMSYPDLRIISTK